MNKNADRELPGGGSFGGRQPDFQVGQAFLPKPETITRDHLDRLNVYHGRVWEVPENAEDTMRKGTHRRRREARMLKQLDGEAAGKALGFVEGEAGEEPACIECGRVEHAEWCRAEDDDEA